MALAISGCTPASGPDPEWIRFRTHFIQPDGRLVDPGRDGISHSEGQGFALLLAVHYNDPATFALVWKWTRSHLQTRPDKLLSWSWTPSVGVRDHNNASDGDVVIAWALGRAGQRWKNPGYLKDARFIARDIREKLLRNNSRGLLLLPWMDGFEKSQGPVLNLSYWVFPALQELETVDPAPEWQSLRKSGLALLQESHFGRWGLPADWVDVADAPVPAADFPAHFGYDAIRIPLYLMWAGLGTPQLLEPYRNYWRYFNGARFIPSWTDLGDDSVDSHDASAGIHAIARLTLAAPNISRVSLPPLNPDSGYYSSALLLLCKVMLAERPR